MADVEAQMEEIEKVVGSSSFPLTQPVLETISGLASTELLAFDKAGSIVGTTLQLSASQAAFVSDEMEGNVRGTRELLLDEDNQFFAYTFPRSPANVSSDRVTSVVVLFDQGRINSASLRAAMLPLATGLSTVILMAGISVFVSRRLVGRMIQLQSRVRRVAAGEFQSQVNDASPDEMGQLGAAVDSMASQLDQLWQEVNRQQGEKLLHQIASGMAHQLRNTLTGSRMAMELHRRECKTGGAGEVAVAVRQLEIAEDYVERLLKLGAGTSQVATPASLIQCLTDLESSNKSIATHLKVDLTFEQANELHNFQVADGVAFTSAIANLIMNAMQAADCVSVLATLRANGACEVCVKDNGPGVDASIAENVFEPFVTSKPEGMGLGLSVVRRAAKELGGEVDWFRTGNCTTFRFRCPTQSVEFEQAGS